MGKYTVKQGDSLWKIAKMHKMNLNDLISMNHGLTMKSVIHPGLTLNVSGKKRLVPNNPANTAFLRLINEDSDPKFLLQVSWQTGGEIPYGKATYVDINGDVINPAYYGSYNLTDYNYDTNKKQLQKLTVSPDQLLSTRRQAAAADRATKGTEDNPFDLQEVVVTAPSSRSQQLLLYVDDQLGSGNPLWGEARREVQTAHPEIVKEVRDGADVAAFASTVPLWLVPAAGATAAGLATAPITTALALGGGYLGSKLGKLISDTIVKGATGYDSLGQLMSAKYGGNAFYYDFYDPTAWAGGYGGSKLIGFAANAYKPAITNARANAQISESYDQAALENMSPSKVVIDPVTGAKIELPTANSKQIIMRVNPDGSMVETAPLVRVTLNRPVAPGNGRGVQTRTYMSLLFNADARGMGRGLGRATRPDVKHGTTTSSQSSQSAPARTKYTIDAPVIEEPVMPQMEPIMGAPGYVVPTIPTYIPPLSPPPTDDPGEILIGRPEQTIEEYVPKNGWGWYLWYKQQPEGTVQHWPGDKDTPEGDYIIKRTNPDIMVRRRSGTEIQNGPSRYQGAVVPQYTTQEEVIGGVMSEPTTVLIDEQIPKDYPRNHDLILTYPYE